MDAKVNGNLTVADDVLADLVGYAAKECYGVVAMASPAPASVQEGIAGLLSSSRRRRAVRAQERRPDRRRRGPRARREHEGPRILTVNHAYDYGEYPDD